MLSSKQSTTKALTVRLPAEQHQQFKIEAARSGESMEALLRGWIEKFLEAAK